MNFAATVHSTIVPLVIEHVWIQNISSHGARVRCHRTWQARDRLVLTSSLGDLQAEAEVVYFQRLATGEYAIGLKFARPLIGQTLLSGRA